MQAQSAQDLLLGLKIAEDILNDLLLEREEAERDETSVPEFKVERLKILNERIEEQRARVKELAELANTQASETQNAPIQNAPPVIQTKEEFENLLATIETIKGQLKDEKDEGKKKLLKALLKEYKDVEKAYQKMQGESIEDLLIPMPTPEQIGSYSNAKKWKKAIQENVLKVKALNPTSEEDINAIATWIELAKEELEYLTSIIDEPFNKPDADEVMHRISIFDPEAGGMTDILVPESDIVTGTYRKMPQLPKDASVTQIMIFFTALRNNMGFYRESGVLDDALHAGIISNLSRILRLLGTN